MRSSWHRAAAVLAAVTVPAAVLAGCSETTGGNASAGSSTGRTETSTPESDAPSSTSKAPADRPKTINLRDVDPCTLLTEQQRAQLGLDRPPLKNTNSAHSSPACNISREDRRYYVGLSTVTTAGTEWYTDGNFLGDVQNLQVGGFPAVVGTAKDDPYVCFIAVDVSDGQMVDVQAGSAGEADRTQLCQVAQQSAGAAVETLMSR
ncbi:DUF3558 domain-containing protein [Saccharothrix coeruleofusca]|uniref:DUF3558 domain-containing protein n=1 Tax=Saccharothrix coeruleofusca TaxID=33919 RepID=A0A918EGF7_9PSEU|nr:DUF3558 domain-containing protein [Saccharothrix coeruleofusca]GGP80879.1 hypothetical protein GCM10010185_63520 [Saccharothrix coeruleofusca]